MKTLRQQQHEQLLEQLRAQGAIALDIPQLYQQEGEGESSAESSSESSSESDSSSTATGTGEDLTGLKNSLAAARREQDEAIRKFNATQSELTSAQQSLTETQGTLGSLQSERDDLKIDLALSNELRDVDPSKRDLLWNTARSQVALSDGEVKAGDRPQPAEKQRCLLSIRIESMSFSTFNASDKLAIARYLGYGFSPGEMTTIERAAATVQNLGAEYVESIKNLIQ